MNPNVTELVKHLAEGLAALFLLCGALYTWNANRSLR